jgi:hypothetical protein
VFSAWQENSAAADASYVRAVPQGCPMKAKYSRQDVMVREDTSDL